MLAAAHTARSFNDAAGRAVAKLRLVSGEHDAIAMLRADWSKSTIPPYPELAGHMKNLQPVDGRQFDRLDRLPARLPDLVPLDADDPIGVLLEKPEFTDVPTASIGALSPMR